MLRVGIVGPGAVAKMHIASYQQLPQTVITAVCASRKEHAEAVAAELHCAAYTDVRKMIAEQQLDLISVCSPSAYHMEAVMAAAEAGVHIVCEKPLDISLEKIDAMIAACREHGVQLHCIFNNRFIPGNAFVHNAIEAGRFGRMINGNVAIRWYRDPGYYLNSSWHGKKNVDGGAVLINQGSHYTDLLLWMMGPVASVASFQDHLFHTSIEAEDTAAAVLRFQNGAIGTILTTTSTYPGYPAELQLTGTRGSCTLQDGYIKEWHFKDSDPLDEEAKQYFLSEGGLSNRASDPMGFSCREHLIQISHAVSCIQNGGTPLITGEEARRPVETILACYRSCSEHRMIDL